MVLNLTMFIDEVDVKIFGTFHSNSHWYFDLERILCWIGKYNA